MEWPVYSASKSSIWQYIAAAYHCVNTSTAAILGQCLTLSHWSPLILGSSKMQQPIYQFSNTSGIQAWHTQSNIELRGFATIPCAIRFNLSIYEFPPPQPRLFHLRWTEVGHSLLSRLPPFISHDLLVGPGDCCALPIRHTPVNNVTIDIMSDPCCSVMYNPSMLMCQCLYKP